MFGLIPGFVGQDVSEQIRIALLSAYHTGTYAECIESLFEPADCFV